MAPTAHAGHGVVEPGDPDWPEYRNRHVMDQGVTFRLHSGSLNTDQRNSITAAAEEWETDIGKSDGGLDFAKGTNYTGSSPQTAWDDSNGANRLMWQGSYSSVNWGCQSTAEACSFTRWVPNQTNCINSGYACHYYDVDTIFRSSIAWKTDFSECGADVGGGDGKADQFSFALHEFGHWIHLFTSGNPGSVMAVDLDDHCWSDISFHDEDTVFNVYAGDTSHTHVGH